MHKLLNIISLLLFATACGSGVTNKKSTSDTVEASIIVPAFNADSAYSFVETQVAFGYRVPNTASHRACGNWLVEILRSYNADVIEQNMELTAYNGDKLQARNIIAQFQPEKKRRILLCAHWDTRPWADSDPDKSNHYKPILGANDGASGVGVLLEIARQISAVPTETGIDIVLFDAEDYGVHRNDEDKYPNSTASWALGSQYWSRIPHKADYNARYGILLDIVGAPQSKFHKEGISTHFASNVVDKVWRTAASLGYGDTFINADGGTVTDDHLFVNRFLGIPCIDIINYDPDSENGFGPYHHTIKDNIDWIDKSTLTIVGQTVLSVIYNEK